MLTVTKEELKGPKQTTALPHTHKKKRLEGKTRKGKIIGVYQTVTSIGYDGLTDVREGWYVEVY